MTIDCDCDDGIRDNGICPDCYGVGWYVLQDEMWARVAAWVEPDPVWTDAQLDRAKERGRELAALLAAAEAN